MNLKRITGLWLQDPLGDPTAVLEVTFILFDCHLRMKKITMQGAIILPDTIRGKKKASSLYLRLVPLVLLKEDLLKRDPKVLQYPMTKCLGDQRTKHSTSI